MFDKLKKAFGGSKEPKVEEKIEEAAPVENAENE